MQIAFTIHVGDEGNGDSGERKDRAEVGAVVSTILGHDDNEEQDEFNARQGYKSIKLPPACFCCWPHGLLPGCCCCMKPVCWGTPVYCWPKNGLLPV